MSGVDTEDERRRSHRHRRPRRIRFQVLLLPTLLLLHICGRFIPFYHISTILLPQRVCECVNAERLLHLLYGCSLFIIQDYRRESNSKTQVFYVTCKTVDMKKCASSELFSAECENKFHIKLFEVRICEECIASNVEL